MTTEVLERPAIKTNLNTKETVLNSLAVGKTSIEISKNTGYPDSTIRSFHKNNKAEVNKRKAELTALIPNILEEFKYDCLTSTELSKYLYRPLEYDNKTALQDNAEITSHKNSLTKQKMRILENTGIFDSRMALLNLNAKSITINQQNVINPSITRLIGTSSVEKLEAIDVQEVSDDT